MRGWRSDLTKHVVSDGNSIFVSSKKNQIINQDLAKVVVIGASHAGISFADHMRKNEFRGSLIIIDRQKGGPMERPPLSKAFLLQTENKVNPNFLLKRAKWYKDEQITLRHGTSISKIDPISKKLITSNGDYILYDKLVLATGAVPRTIPASEGMSNVFVLRQPDDAVAIRQTARSSKSAIIIGGGYIGLEVAATLRQMGLTVSVIEAAERLLARVASPPVATLLDKLHHSHGVKLHIGIGVETITQEKGVFSSVTLNNGTILAGDMLIVGIGVAPDSRLAYQASVETEHANGGAILVDESFRTSDPNIFAIGDVALQRGKSIRIESVHNAQDSGARAAASIMGKIQPKIQAPWFWSDQYDINLQSVGIVPTNVSDIYQIFRKGKRKLGESFWTYRGKQLLAVEAIGDPENFILGKKCLEEKISPDPKMIGDENFDPLA